MTLAFGLYMTAQELNELIRHISPKRLAKHLGIRQYTLDYYRKDQQPIPQDIAAAVRFIAKEYSRNPWAACDIGNRAKDLRRAVRNGNTRPRSRITARPSSSGDSGP